MSKTVPVVFSDPKTHAQTGKVHLCLRHLEVCKDSYPPEEVRVFRDIATLEPCTWCVAESD